MRWLILLGVLAGGAPAAAMSTLRECETAIRADPAQAREAAARWIVLGGRAAARICEAYALEALGATGVAALRMTELAQDRGVVLAPEMRAELLREASVLWGQIGAEALAAETRAAARSVSDGSLTPPVDPEVVRLAIRTLIEIGRYADAAARLDDLAPGAEADALAARLPSAQGGVLAPRPRLRP